MPIYEYYCPQCGKFEVIKPMARCAEPTSCPSCGKESKRIMSRFSIYDLNWTQTDGEGFTSKSVRKEELAEMNQEIRER